MVAVGPASLAAAVNTCSHFSDKTQLCRLLLHEFQTNYLHIADERRALKRILLYVSTHVLQPLQITDDVKCFETALLKFMMMINGVRVRRAAGMENARGEKTDTNQRRHSSVSEQIPACCSVQPHSCFQGFSLTGRKRGEEKPTVSLRLPEGPLRASS